jgi:hypothetical protein
MYSSQPELRNWTKVSYTRGISTQEEIEREAKQTKESEDWLDKTSTSSRYTALLEEESEDQQRKMRLRKEFYRFVRLSQEPHYVSATSQKA